MICPLDLCTIEHAMIKVGTERSHRLECVTVHRFVDFGAHRTPSNGDFFSERWSITHLPSGRVAASGFRTIDSAAAAMIEIARLRNDWACIEEADAAAETARRVEEIVKRHDERAIVSGKRRGRALGNNLNGYAGQSA